MVAHIDEDVPKAITSDLIRCKFADTIFPLVDIVFELLQPKGSWWEHVCENGRDEEDRSSFERYLVPWREMISVFHEYPKFHAPLFVQIGSFKNLIDIDDSLYPGYARLVHVSHGSGIDYVG